ncbi:magnesium transport protein CorA [Pilimelia terevasa]|uniref:Magnesium transport protein CorA n=1 Tax=Pilimelia terevasa TaxID=53372 RepID=A0A8J3FKC4_9ACTN|nr:CorA family divalent cation transporter [Pilimelia terevasa]GGK32645.1 magnesium transport protein CorA [Pilimelia terevasa]
MTGAAPDTADVVACLRYAGGRWQEVADPYGPGLDRAAEAREGFTWLALRDPPADRLAEVRRRLGLPEAVDVAEAGADDPVTVEVGTVGRDPAGGLRTGELTVTVAPRLVLAVHRGADGPLGAVAHHLAHRRHGATVDRWTVVLDLVQHVVTGYPDALEAVAGEINALEELVFDDRPDDGVVNRIHRLKRDLVELRRAMVPAQRPLGALADGDEPPLPGRVRRRLRQLREEVVQAVEQLNGYDDLLNSIFQARLAQISVAQNDDMRKIASWAAIAAVQTIVAGIYGMNFSDMPELHWPYGYPAVLTLMAGSAALLYWRLRRAGWL